MFIEGQKMRAFSALRSVNGMAFEGDHRRVAGMGVAAVAMVAAGLVGACSSEETVQPTPRMPPPVEAKRVETIQVESKSASLVLNVPGEIEARRDSNLSSATGGYVEKVLVREGDLVQKGQSLAWINRTVAEAQLSQAMAQLSIAQHESEVTAQAQQSVSKTRRIMAEAQLAQAEAQVRMAQVGANQARLRAPFTGRVARVFIEEGEVAPPGAPAMRLVSSGTVKVSISLSARDLASLRQGDKAQVYVSGTGETIAATVKRISPAADLNTRTFLADLELPNDRGQLAPGMLANVRIETRSEAGGISIPQHALVTRLKGNGVFVIEESKAVWRDVQIQRLVGHEALISEGLSLGEQLVVKGHRELKDGDAVLVAEAQPLISATNPASETEAQPQ